jgi:AcrR family transcriptional regulator
MPTPPSSDGRRHRTLATRAAIRRAALELVAERGLDDVTVELIAERADVGYRTFFNHFGSKEDAVVDGGEERAEAMLSALRAQPADEDTVQAVREVFLQEAASIEGREDELALRFAVLESSPVLMRRFHAEFAVIERTLVSGIAERLGIDPEQSFYPQVLAATAGTLLRAAVLRWRGRGGSNALPRGALIELVAEGFDLLAAGLPAPVRPTAAPHR